MSKKYKNPEKASLLGLTWPIFAQTFLNFLIGFVDTFMLSRYSDNAVGAVGLANQIIYIITLLLGMIGSGAVILISQNLGAGKKETADEIATISVILNLEIGVVLSVVLFVSRYIILGIMNCPDDFMGYSQTFLGIVGGGYIHKSTISYYEFCHVKLRSYKKLNDNKCWSKSIKYFWKLSSYFQTNKKYP